MLCIFPSIKFLYQGSRVTRDVHQCNLCVESCAEFLPCMCTSNTLKFTADYFASENSEDDTFTLVTKSEMLLTSLGTIEFHHSL